MRRSGWFGGVLRSSRWRAVLPGLWAGWLLCVALLATPAPFALLAQADAGRVVARMLAQEAYTSLALGVVLLVLERITARRAAEVGQGRQFTLGMGLALGTLFCTVAGYFAVQPLMAAARAGAGGLTFGQLHTLSAAFYALKLLLVLALAWMAAGRAGGSDIEMLSPASS
jgi:hypothetical protein